MLLVSLLPLTTTPPFLPGQVSDRDLAPEGDNFDETGAHLEEAVSLAADLQKQTGVRPLYFGCDLFSHPRYVHGAAANPDAHVFAYACAQVKRGLEAAKRLGAENFVFFHPRDGYESLLQRQPLRDASHLAQLYRMAAAYRDKLGYKGQLMVQPRHAGPRRHQYEADAAAAMHLLRHFGLDKQYKLNIRPASARLQGREADHDVQMAAAYNMLGSIDAADAFPSPDGAASDLCSYDVRDATLVMKCVLEMVSGTLHVYVCVCTCICTCVYVCVCVCGAAAPPHSLLPPSLRRAEWGRAA